MPIARFSTMPCRVAVGWALALAMILAGCGRGSSDRGQELSQADAEKLARKLSDRQATERALDEGHWAKERLAEQCGEIFERLWDAVNAATNKLATLATLPAREIIPPTFGPAQLLEHGIEARAPGAPAAAWTPERWRAFLAGSEQAGWQLDNCEVRQVRFETDARGQAQRSHFAASGHFSHRLQPRRAVLRGELIVDWSPSDAPGGAPAIQRLDASGLRQQQRAGAPAFTQIFDESLTPPEGSYFIDPLILYDLDGDGVSEIILAAKNLVLRRRGSPGLVAEQLCVHSPGLITTAVIADFDGDGVADFLCAKFEGLVLFKGSPGGKFDQPGQLVWAAEPHLKYAQVLTCGDVDGDGDLDVWLGQYKVPYERGQMPTPYHDANDGHPSYLLLNDGHGNFTDATESAGLAAKRFRRTYSASFVDLDLDGHLDLMVVSDFAGLDLYRNDGRGRFTDITRASVAEPHAAGMAHVVADFDRDGRPDLLMAGMTSATADRLRHLGLARPGVANDLASRSALMHGSRLYQAQAGGRFVESALGESIARSGWSWGTSAFDFDNDGFVDVYFANGHETKESVREYEPEFWLHDAYLSSSRPDVVLAAYYGAKFARTRGQGASYGGYDKNRLYLNRGGKEFLEIGQLMGVALEPDSRNVVADDLDGDGRVDLLVTTFEVWPERKQTLQIFKNNLPDAGNWIGFRLREQGGGVSPVGARVTVRTSAGPRVRQIVTGDSYRSQHANTVHFGLGELSQVESVRIQWQNGRTLVLPAPAINRYHVIELPAGQ